MTHPDPLVEIREAVQNPASFRQLVLSGPARPDGARWLKVSLRPVVLKAGRRIQFTYTDARGESAKNFTASELGKELEEVLAAGFQRLHLQTDSGDVHVRITRKGKVLVSRGGPSSSPGAAEGSHDRAKKHPLGTAASDSFLRAIGIKTEAGEVRPSMQAKFRQVNAFIGLIEPLVNAAEQPVTMIDCGCGSAYLTFAAFHYFRHVRGMEVRLVGVDRNPDIIGKCKRLRDELQWSGLDFHVASIADFTPPESPAVVFSLHACDTATDEAIAQGIRWGSRAIVASPCCQHELHHKLQAPALAPVLRHGILRERLADLLTDTFRALVLRIMGYRSEVVEFVSAEHTPKNLVIRAEKAGSQGDEEAVKDYVNLKAFLGVEPAIEALVGEPLRARGV